MGGEGGTQKERRERDLFFVVVALSLDKNARQKRLLYMGRSATSHLSLFSSSSLEQQRTLYYARALSLARRRTHHHEPPVHYYYYYIRFCAYLV